MRVPPLAFFITKYFGSGVIIATAFIHVSDLSLQLLNSMHLQARLKELLPE